MKPMTAGILGVLTGAAVVIGAEAVFAGSVLSKIQHKTANANGYSLKLFWLPAVVGQGETVGVSLTQSGKPVSNAPIVILVQKQSGNVTFNLVTDKNGVTVFDVTAWHGQNMTITATYADSKGTTIVQDVANVVVAPSVGG